MKNALKVLGLLGLFVFVLSCGKNSNPSNEDLFVGTYEGSVSYKDNNDDVHSDDSSVTVVKVGDKYNFQFNKSGIPMLTGIKFNREGKNTMVNLDFEDGLRVINIDANSLNIHYSKDGKTWTAKAKR